MKGFLLALMVVAIACAPAAAFAQQSGNSASGGFMKDSWLTTKAKSRLFADKRVKATAIEVETRNAVVILRGKVRSTAERTAAEEVARGTEGVKGVANVLQVVPDAHRKAVDARDEEIKRAVMLRLEGDNSLKHVAVRSDAAMVTLTGTVGDVGAMRRAADMAKAAPGVKMVRNEISVKPARAAKK